MKAYGYRPGDELNYKPWGAPTRHQKMTGKNRTAARRLLHKQASNDAKKIIARGMAA